MNGKEYMDNIICSAFPAVAFPVRETLDQKKRRDIFLEKEKENIVRETGLARGRQSR